MILDISPLARSTNYKIVSNAVTPRPIAWVSSISKDGVVNLAPFSFFAPLCTAPLIFSISVAPKTDGSIKDTLLNAKDTRRLTISSTQRALLEAMVDSANELPHNQSEFDAYNIEPRILDPDYPPMVSGSLTAFMCDFREVIEFGSGASTLIIEAKKVFIDDSIYNEDLKFSIDNVGRVGRSFI